MKIIDDKEVGKIWKVVRETKAYPVVYEVAIPLIRKLVAERAALIAAKLEVPMTRMDIKEAINEFGIDPADWKDDD